MKDKKKFKSALSYFGLCIVGCFIIVLSLQTGDIIVAGGNTQSENHKPIEFYTTLLIFGLISVVTFVLGLIKLLKPFYRKK